MISQTRISSVDSCLVTNLESFPPSCGCCVHTLSKACKKKSARGPWVAQHHPFDPLRGDPPFLPFNTLDFTSQLMKMLFLMTCWRTSSWSTPAREVKHGLWWGRWGWRRERKGGSGNETSPPKGWELLVYKIHLSFTRSWKSIFGLAQAERYANTSCFLRVFDTNFFSSWMKSFNVFLWCLTRKPKSCR